MVHGGPGSLLLTAGAKGSPSVPVTMARTSLHPRATGVGERRQVNLFVKTNDMKLETPQRERGLPASNPHSRVLGLFGPQSFRL